LVLDDDEVQKLARVLGHPWNKDHFKQLQKLGALEVVQGVMRVARDARREDEED